MLERTCTARLRGPGWTYAVEVVSGGRMEGKSMSDITISSPPAEDPTPMSELESATQRPATTAERREQHPPVPLVAERSTGVVRFEW